MKPRYTNQSTERILRLAKSFPCLARKLEGWHPAEFDPEQFLALMDGWSHGELLCAMFIVSVWDPGSAKLRGWKFDLFEFAGTADPDHRVALMLWLACPSWY